MIRLGRIGCILGVAAALAACVGPGDPDPLAQTAGPSPAVASNTSGAADASQTPDWYAVELTDVQTGETFTLNDLRGSIVLIEAMAIWCPTCLEQQAEVKKLHALLAERDDLVSVSLDVDLHEDAASLREYAVDNDLDWRVAVAPLEVARALGNLYSAQFLNPPVSPMLLIDRDGTAIELPYGVKRAEVLQEILEPYLAG